MRLLYYNIYIFVGGCGRFFEGDASDMVAALGQLRNLPADTEVYCGHEYTVSNLEFGLWLEPWNGFLVEELEKCRTRALSGIPTVPFTLRDQVHN